MAKSTANISGAFPNRKNIGIMTAICTTSINAGENVAVPNPRQTNIGINTATAAAARTLPRTRLPSPITANAIARKIINPVGTNTSVAARIDAEIGNARKKRR